MKKIILTIIILILSLPLFSFGNSEVNTLTWWHSNSGKNGEAVDALVKEFNESIGKENDIYVEAIYQGKANDVLTKVKAASLSSLDSLPDLVQLDSTGVVDMVNDKNVYYIEDLASDLGENLDFLLPHAKVSMTYKDKLIAVPFNASTILFYYNKTLFDELGLEVPKTIDDVILIADKLVSIEDGEIIRHALSLVPTTYELCAFIGQQNAYITDNKNGHDGVPTKTSFKKELENFLTKWKELYKTGSLSQNTNGLTSSFAAGKNATLIASTSVLSTLIDTIGGRFELGAAPLFKVDENANGGVNIGGGALFTFKKDNSEAIFTFIKFLTSKESQLFWNMETGYLPINKDTYEMSEYLNHIDDNPLFAVASKQLLDSNPNTVGLWIPNGYDIYYSIQSNIKYGLENDLSVVKIVNNISSEIDGVLDEFNSKLSN